MEPARRRGSGLLTASAPTPSGPMLRQKSPIRPTPEEAAEYSSTNLAGRALSGSFTSSSLSVGQERGSNLFLQSLRPDRQLQPEFERCRPVHAILVPCSAAIEAAHLDDSHMTPSFLRAHCVRFVNRAKGAFISILGQKGDFANDFQSVTVGTKRLAILRRMPADALTATAGDAPPDIYLVSDIAVALEDLAAEDARQRTSEGQQSSFKEFQNMLQQDRRIRNVAKSIGAFFKQCSTEGVLSPPAVRLFIDTTVGDLIKADIWTEARAVEELNEHTERYIMTKLFEQCLESVSEKGNPDALQDRIRLLFPWVSPQQLGVPAALLQQRAWNEATRALTQLIDVKSPKDKVICVFNIVAYVNQAAQKLKPPPSDGGFLQSALIICVGQANVARLADHLNYVSQFRWREKLRGEVAFYITALQNACAFWMTCTADQLAMKETDFQAALAGAVKGTSKTVPSTRTQIIEEDELKRRMDWDENFMQTCVDRLSSLQVDADKDSQEVTALQASLGTMKVEIERSKGAIGEYAAPAAPDNEYLAHLIELHQSLSMEVLSIHNAVEQHVTHWSKTRQDSQRQAEETSSELKSREDYLGSALSAWNDALTERERQVAAQSDALVEMSKNERQDLERIRTQDELNLERCRRELAQQESELHRRIAEAEAAAAARTDRLNARERSMDESMKARERQITESMNARQALLSIKEKQLKDREEQLERQTSQHKAAVQAAHANLSAERAAAAEMQRKISEENAATAAEIQKLLGALAANRDVLEARIETFERNVRESKAHHMERDELVQRQQLYADGLLEFTNIVLLRRDAEAAVHAKVIHNERVSALAEIGQQREAIEQRMAQDRATIDAIQANVTARDAALRLRESKLDDTIRGIQSEADKSVNEARKLQLATAAECARLFQDGANLIREVDHVGDAAQGYEGLRVSDLQNVWKTMQQLRELRNVFQSKSSSAQQAADSSTDAK